MTDPLDPDTDGDGFDDGVELLAGSDPTSSASVPAASRLPIVDDFEDGVLNVVDWMANLDIPGGGAAVTETGGHLSLIGRGHLVTTGQFDPELVGGLIITGEWTFVAGDDFIQIITRSDGIPDPANCCGERPVCQSGAGCCADLLPGREAVAWEPVVACERRTVSYSSGLLPYFLKTMSQI